ncbi:hypothetical protein BDV93DRAFT_514506 [Ceratobasidium sp. AG-I]|nr:hypothetical protein BDV93DRAFT_514506 [Ceratobasidium sp. AG-I]
MPMHRIYTAQGLYTPAEKHALSKAITAVYQGSAVRLPDFYVVVLFIDLPKDSYFIGGEPNDAFVRFNIQHLARHFDKDQKLGFMKMYEEAIKPFTAHKGLDWEVNLDEADQLTWHENGMSPPAPKSEGEALWIKLNKAVPFEGPTFSDLD